MEKSTFNPASVFNSLQYGFSQAVEVRGGRRLLLSGQVGVDEQERTVGPGLREQTEQAFDNIERVLAAAGGQMADVVMLRIYIAEAPATSRNTSVRYCWSALPACRRRLRGSSSAVCPCPSG